MDDQPDITQPHQSTREQTPTVAAASRWQAAGGSESDGPEVRALFSQVFGTPMSDALWRWKYAQGRGHASLVRDASTANAQLVAHYGGMRRPIWLRGARHTALQMGDVMVAPHVRGILGRRGPFALGARHMIENHVGELPGSAIGFGFPNARASQLGERLGLYRGGHEVYEIRWPAQETWVRPLQRWQLQRLPMNRSSAQLADALWKRMRESLTNWVLPERDSEWIHHRYEQHPEFQYQYYRLFCQWTRRMAGMLIIKPPSSSSSGGTWELMDWIGAPEHFVTAVRTLRVNLSLSGGTSLLAWVSQPISRQFEDAQLLRDAHRQVVCTWSVTEKRNTRIPSDIEGLSWWLTGGDTDFR